MKEILNVLLPILLILISFIRLSFIQSFFDKRRGIVQVVENKKILELTNDIIFKSFMERRNKEVWHKIN